MANRIWCGSGKAFGNYGQIGLNICLTDLPVGFITEYNGKKYIRLKVSQRKEVDKRGNTHSVEVDTWKPQAKQNNGAPMSQQNDLPF